MRTRHKTTEARRSWAEEQARRNPATTNFDNLMLYYLFTSTEGPDCGIEGDVEPPSGEVPSIEHEVGASVGGESSGFSDSSTTPDYASSTSSTESGSSFGESGGGSSSSDSGDSGGGDSGGSGGSD